MSSRPSRTDSAAPRSSVSSCAHHVRQQRRATCIDHIARAALEEEDKEVKSHTADADDKTRNHSSATKCVDSTQRAVTSVLKQDELLKELGQHITNSRKLNERIELKKAATWAPRSAAALWGRAREVLLLQQEVKQFKAEVKEWYQKYPPLEGPKHADMKIITDRQEHRLEFWAKYRSRGEERDLIPAPPPPPPAAPGQLRPPNVLGRGLPRDCVAACAASGGPLDTRGQFWGGRVAAQDAGTAGGLRAQARASARNEKHSILAGLASAAADAAGVVDIKKGSAHSGMQANSLSWTRRATRDTHYMHKGWALGRRFGEQASCLQDSSSAPELLQVDMEDELEPEQEQERRQLLRLLPDIKGAPGAKLMFTRVAEDELDKRRPYGRNTAARWQRQIKTVLDNPDLAELSPVHTRDSRHWAAGYDKEVASNSLHSSRHSCRFSTGHRWEIPGAGHSARKTSQKKQLEEVTDNAAGWARRSKRASMGRKVVSLPNLTQREAVSSMHRPRASTTAVKKSKRVGGNVESLPPINGAFAEGWRDEKHASDLRSSPTKRYVRACEHFGVLPTPSLPLVTGQSLKLQAGDKSLVDSDLLAVAAMVRSMKKIEEVDLEGNTLLTEKALIAFFKKMFGKPASSTLEILSIKRCLHAGRGGALDVIVRLLSEPDGLRSLRHLDLSGVSLSTRCHIGLSNAIWEHPALRSVSLAETGLGNSPFSEQCVAKLLSSGNVQSLDIGWNTFNTEAFMRIGEQLVGTQALQSLSLSNCSAVSDNISNTSILFLLEHLARDRSLTFLDISLNRIDFKGALVIEDALEQHRGLTKISIAHNPVGIVGVRSLFRLLARGSSGVLQFMCDGCFALDHPTPVDAQLFHSTRLNGHYTLDLGHPYDRALLRMLYKTCERVDVNFADSFRNAEFTCPSFEHPRRKDSAGLWPVPSEGTLSVDFNLLQVASGEHGGLSDSQFIECFEEHLSQMKVHIDPCKVVAMLALWESMDGQVKEQRVMVDALSADLLFTYPFLEQLCSNHPFVSEIVPCLLPCITGGPVARHLSALLAPTLVEQLSLRKRMSALQQFNLGNPTGHYQLDLSDPLQTSIGERLLCLDEWETLIARRNQWEDISQRGNYSQIRNEEFQNEKLRVNVVASWNLPAHGVFKFDYVSGRRPPIGGPELKSQEFSQILQSLQQSQCAVPDQVKALRQVSSQFYLTSLQLRQLLVNLGDRSVAEEVGVLFFMRVSDICNEKQFRVRLPDLQALRHRLGYIATFPFFQPENYEFELNFGVYEQRIAGKLLTSLAFKELQATVRNLSYVHADGKQDNLPNGLPRLWIDATPTEGYFRGKYTCSPDDRNLGERRRLLETYGRWTFANSNVEWWSDVREAPEDVLMYLQLIIGKHGELAQAFREIDGLDGNGIISLREFEDSIREMKNPNFQGPDAKRRIMNIYRYLDCNGESGDGGVSMKEWSVLEQLWREMTSSIVEFSEGLARKFNRNLDAAWRELDSDGNGGLDEREWCAAAEKVGYFGPAKVVFQFLDNAGAGIVSMKQFERLRTFRKSPFFHRDAVKHDHSTILRLQAMQKQA